jgi:DNA transformation protein
MDADGLKALFQPFGAVEVKRMFGGYGIYADGLCFAIQPKGEVFLKADPLSEPIFSAAGSSPFVFEAKGPRPTGAFRSPPMTIARSSAAGPRWDWRLRGARPPPRRSRPNQNRIRNRRCFRRGR